MLSDIHANATDELFENRCGHITRDLIAAMQRITQHFADDVQGGLLLLGDLTHGSGRAEYELFTQHVLRPFSDALGADTRTYAVPGNHDHLRDAIPVTATVPAGVPPAPVSLHPKKIVDHYDRGRIVGQARDWELRVGSRFFPFDRWSRENTSIRPDKTAGPWKVVLQPPARSKVDFDLHLVGINSAIACDGSGDEEDLWIHDAQVGQVLTQEPADGMVTLTLLHHAPDRDLDEHDGEALNLLYERSSVILHGHYHQRGGEPATVGRPPILRAPALGHPRPALGVDPNKRDGCAVLRLLRDRAQIFFLSHRQPENNERMTVEYGTRADGTPLPDSDLTYRPSLRITRVGA